MILHEQMDLTDNFQRYFDSTTVFFCLILSNVLCSIILPTLEKISLESATQGPHLITNGKLLSVREVSRKRMFFEIRDWERLIEIPSCTLLYFETLTRVLLVLKIIKTIFNYCFSGRGQNTVIPVVCDVSE